MDTSRLKQLASELRQKTEMEKSMKMARLRQLHMLPAMPKVDGYEFKSIYLPCTNVSGDFYDFIKVSEFEIGIALGDVSGHGIEAGLAQARLLDKYDPAKPPSFEPGDHRQNSNAFKAEAIAALKPKLQKLKIRYGAATEDLAAVALSYVLAQPRVACVIPGFRNEKQVQCNLAAEGKKFTAEDVAFVREALK